MTDYPLTLVADNLGFPEGPRWHNKQLFFSDFNQQVVRSIDLNGKIDLVAHIPQSPSGLGWLPDGRLLIVSMQDHKLLIQNIDGSIQEHADLSHIATGPSNDMVVDNHGRAYIGNFGGTNITLDSTVSADLAMVSPQGEVSIAATGLNFPNGSVITPDGKTLIIAETMARQLSAFTIDDKGKLSNKRLWADLGDIPPDGICQDSEGGIWVATVFNEVIRVLEGGEITNRITTDRGCFACALGGAKGTTLYLCTSGSPAPGQPSCGQIVSVEVSIPALAS